MKPVFSAVLLALLAGCAPSPAAHIYLLGPAGEPAPGVRDDIGRKVIELKPVRVPDHLDTTDILLRTSTNTGTSELRASTTGVWGERLSIGITHALAGALIRREPAALVVTRPPVADPSVQILVDVTALQARDDGDCTLTAHWTILRGGNAPRPKILASAQGSFITRANGAGDAAVVAAINGAIDQLADQIAAGVRF